MTIANPIPEEEIRRAISVCKHESFDDFGERLGKMLEQLLEQKQAWQHLAEEAAGMIRCFCYPHHDPENCKGQVFFKLLEAARELRYFQNGNSSDRKKP